LYIYWKYAKTHIRLEIEIELDFDQLKESSLNSSENGSLSFDWLNSNLISISDTSLTVRNKHNLLPTLQLQNVSWVNVGNYKTNVERDRTKSYSRTK